MSDRKGGKFASKNQKKSRPRDSPANCQPGNSSGPTAALRRVVSDAATASVENVLISTADPVSVAMRVVGAAERRTVIGQGAEREPNAWAAYCDHLDKLTGKLRQNDMSAVEDMLFAQAIALQSLFVRLSEGALAAETIPNYDMKFRYALRAQSQCRATLETLATIKNPPVLFARQANLSNGPQQINNTITAAPGDARARETGSGQNELLGAPIDGQLSKNGSASTFALAADPALATLGEIDGPADGGRQGALISKCMEGRQLARRASPASKGVEGTRTGPSRSRGVK